MEFLAAYGQLNVSDTVEVVPHFKLHCEPAAQVSESLIPFPQKYGVSEFELGLAPKVIVSPLVHCMASEYGML